MQLACWKQSSSGPSGRKTVDTVQGIERTPFADCAAKKPTRKCIDIGAVLRWAVGKMTPTSRHQNISPRRPKATGKGVPYTSRADASPRHGRPARPHHKKPPSTSKELRRTTIGHTTRMDRAVNMGRTSADVHVDGRQLPLSNN